MTGPRIVTAPTVTPMLEIGVGDARVVAGVGRWGVSQWGRFGSTWVGAEPLWWDVSCDVHEVRTHVGRARSIDAFDVGTLTAVLRNQSGWADYPPLGGDTVLSLRPGRPIRLGVTIGGDVTWLWRGYIDEVTPAYDPVRGSIVTINAVDAKGEAGRVSQARLDVEVGAGEIVTARIHRILNAARWPSTLRTIAQSPITLVGTVAGGKTADLLDVAAMSAGGAIYGDVAGRVVFRPADWQSRPADTEPDGLIGNAGDAGEVCPGTWETSFARADFSSQVLYSRRGEPEQTIDDASAQASYGVETFQMLNLDTEADADMHRVAARALAVRSFGRAPRVAAVTLDAARPGVAELAAAADPFKPSMYRCTLVLGDGRRIIDGRIMYLVGVDHVIDDSAWIVRLALDDATAYLTGYSVRWQTTGRWSRPAWSTPT